MSTTLVLNPRTCNNKAFSVGLIALPYSSEGHAVMDSEGVVLRLVPQTFCSLSISEMLSNLSSLLGH